jgi:penicillin-binding protein 2
MRSMYGVTILKVWTSDFMGYDLPTGNILIPKRTNACIPNGGWRSTTIISNSIGQGEVLMTPIQLASMMASC